jgi:hypothetical protein
MERRLTSYRIRDICVGETHFYDDFTPLSEGGLGAVSDPCALVWASRTYTGRVRLSVFPKKARAPLPFTSLDNLTVRYGNYSLETIRAAVNRRFDIAYALRSAQLTEDTDKKVTKIESELVCVP